MVSTKTASNSQNRRTWLHWFVYRVPFVMPVLMGIMHRMQMTLLGFYKPKEDVLFLKRVYQERQMLLQPLEAYALLVLARAQSHVDGDMAEVGMYRGASAKIICEGKGKVTLWGFDTFEGLCDVSEEDKHWGISFFKQGGYRASYDEVRSYLTSADDIRLIPGYFPQSANDAVARTFSFVHLDVDTYSSTLESMRFFWPRLSNKGIIVTHDSHAEGVARAIREFVSESGARIIPMACSQMMLLR